MEIYKGYLTSINLKRDVLDDKLSVWSTVSGAMSDMINYNDESATLYKVTFTPIKTGVVSVKQTVSIKQNKKEK